MIPDDLEECSWCDGGGTVQGNYCSDGCCSEPVTCPKCDGAGTQPKGEWD